MTADRVADGVAPLAAFIRARITELAKREGHRISFQDLADRSGGLISKQTAWRLSTARYRGQPLDDLTIEGLAVALEVKRDLVEELLPSAGSPYVPPPESALLDDDQRKLVDSLIRALAKRD